MFESLYIKNLALVTELELNFSKGFSVVTGETGAGKSLIFGAFQLLLGGRADKGMIRKDAKSCEIAASFLLKDIEETRKQKIETFLTELGIEKTEEQTLLIRRVITFSGTRCYLNGGAVPVNVLKQLGELLVDIHGPNEQQTLFFPSVQLQFLDDYLNNPQLISQVLDSWQQLVDKKKYLQEIQQNVLSENEIDYVRFQLKEIENAGLTEGEDEKINQRYKLISSGKRLLELSTNISQKIDGDGQDVITDQLTNVLSYLSEIANLDEQNGGEFQERMENIIELIRDLSSDLLNYSERLEIDAEELHFLENRMELIYKIKRRYGGSVSAALKQAEIWRTQLDIAENQELKIETCKKEIQQLEKQFLQKSSLLTEARKKAAQKLEIEITNKLRVLGFLQSVFKIEIKTCSPNSKGIDTIDFYFAPNPGEGIQPLRKIGSSGELARIMLAIKTVLGNADQIPVLIFDEVDANIGGRVALDVAKEMKNLGIWHQVFAITHLAQIAAAGDSHYLVKKSVEGTRTFTHIILLEDQDRNLELMRMMGAEATSQSALKHVVEIRELFNKK